MTSPLLGVEQVPVPLGQQGARTGRTARRAAAARPPPRTTRSSAPAAHARSAAGPAGRWNSAATRDRTPSRSCCGGTARRRSAPGASGEHGLGHRLLEGDRRRRAAPARSRRAGRGRRRRRCRRGRRGRRGDSMYGRTASSACSTRSSTGSGWMSCSDQQVRDSSSRASSARTASGGERQHAAQRLAVDLRQRPDGLDRGLRGWRRAPARARRAARRAGRAAARPPRRRAAASGSAMGGPEHRRVHLSRGSGRRRRTCARRTAGTGRSCARCA